VTNPLTIETKFLTLGDEATRVWRNHAEPRHRIVVDDYTNRARTVAKALKCRVCLQDNEGRILYTTPRHREKRA